MESTTEYANASRVSDTEGFVRETPERTLSLTVSYNGAPFSGFARQPGQLTVQGELEQALSLVFRRHMEVVCSGRTDAGVHALGQVVSFDVANDELEGRNLYSLRRSLNALTHEDITVREVEERQPGFSARFDAQWREYHYHVCLDEVPPLFMRDFSWYVHGQLDIDAMREAAAHLVGEHDFKSFCMAASAVGKPTCRNVHEISLSREMIMGEGILTIKVVGNAFLHSMVRTIVGTLVMVGRGQRKPEWVREVLEARNRTAAGGNAPAAGLVFWRVQY
ncbi:tRNA pseudouridine(38-40) synthase TruA [Senegalimassilia faecalis]|uniref:tRNA pseudouridine synthase A n=1 Tax=Senegalimassilia faecalis TaxID=2509433 RepID=A0A4Q2JYI2_9ACTN|nr:tRNA pseudouridine(38-40) synthase TruA [Senegalimassilia faecalis]